MPRGGRRAGRPGVKYPERSDLRSGPMAPTAPTGLAYGQHQALVDAQRQVPMGPAGAATPAPAAPPPAAPAPPAVLPGLARRVRPADGPARRTGHRRTADRPRARPRGPRARRADVGQVAGRRAGRCRVGFGVSGVGAAGAARTGARSMTRRVSHPRRMIPGMTPNRKNCTASANTRSNTDARLCGSATAATRPRAVR
jgi:hypothetical protein